MGYWRNFNIFLQVLLSLKIINNNNRTDFKNGAQNFRLTIHEKILKTLIAPITAFYVCISRAAVVHLNFRAGSTFPVTVYTVSPGHWVHKAAAH